MKTVDELYVELIQEPFRFHINEIVRTNLGFKSFTKDFIIDFSIPNGIFEMEVRDLTGKLIELEDAPSTIKMVYNDLKGFYGDTKKLFNYAYIEYIDENKPEESYLVIKEMFEKAFYQVFCGLNKTANGCLE